MKRQSILAALLAFVASWSVVSGNAHAQTPATVGQWSAGPVWDITPNNMVMLPSGKVLLYPGLFISGNDPRMWDPVTNTLTTLAKPGYDLFCTGHSLLTDGTVLITGGNLTIGHTDGIPTASIYNPVTDVWTRLPDMNNGRWYPSSTSLPNGEVLVTSGWIDSVQQENTMPQIWQPSSGTWRNLTGALLKLWTYPWVYWTSLGKAIVVGPEQPTRYLDISGTGSWTSVGTFNYPDVRSYGTSVMYSSSKILIAGGGDPPTNTAEIFDLNTGTWQTTNAMALSRRHLNSVLLPDDNVLIVGGTSSPGFNDFTSPAYASEMWNPSTQTWTTMASQTVGRFYHSIAILLPDGRIMSAGGDHAYQTELYSPPYLFKGARPTITSAPSSAGYSSTFFVGTPDATSITKVRLIRLAAMTHAFDQNQRIVPVSFSQTTGGLNVTAPTDPNLAPIGHYMLFILNGTGVPSVAKIMVIGVAPTPPAAPIGLTATATSSSTITLTWTDQSTNEDMFKIERALGAGAFSQVATVGPGATTYADSGLTASTSYSYRVRASNTAGNSAYTNTASATTQAVGAAPAAPTGLAATAASSSTINLTWTDQSTNETSFKIERALGAGAFSQVATVGAGATSYSDNGLTASTSYSYRVRASNAGGDSAYSNTASATTPAAPPNIINTSTMNLDAGFAYYSTQNFGTPGDTSGAPTQSVLRIFENGIELGPAHSQWSDISNIGQGRFLHWQNSSGNITLYFSATNNTNPKTNGKTYTYQVGASPPPPAAPSGLTATAASSTSITLTWVDNSTNETGFKIERAVGAGAFSQVATVGASVTTYADSGLTADTSYSYRVRATNTVGDSAYSNTGTTRTLIQAPAAPSGLSATAASSTSITLTWVDNSTFEDTFKIERALGAGAFSQVGTVGTNVTTYADTGLTAATSYSYRVRASNTGGDSAYSNTATATTLVAPPPIPAPPSGLGATATSSTAINLSWTDASTNEDGFKIERKTGAGAFAQIATVGPNITTYADSGLTANTAYSYQVRAYNTGGDSTYSNTASATTLAAPPPIPAPPSGLGATATSSTAINLSWTDASSNEDGFKIERKTGAGAFAQIATVGPNITTYADSGLTASTAYSYQVRAYNTGGDSAYSNTASATTQAAVTVPAAPTGLVATWSSSTAINLTWTDQSNNETGFKIERKTGAGSFTQIATVGPNITTYADSGLTPATNYSYQVRATNSAGDSAYSNTASATTSGLISMNTVTQDSGFAFYSTQSFGTPADASGNPTRSVLRVFENGVELGPAHSLWADISTKGQGRFLHWQNSSGLVLLYFSSSNNTNPKTNGRTYTYRIGSQP